MLQLLTAIHNNFELLTALSILMVKGSKLTKNKYDDYLAGKFTNFLNKFRGGIHDNVEPKG